MKLIVGLIGLVFSFSVFSQGLLFQKKYPGIAKKPAAYLVVNKQTSRIVPYHSYDSYLSQQIGIADKPANHVILNKVDEVVILPYIIVPPNEYRAYMKKYAGYANKPANHIRVNGKEVIVLSSNEVNTNLSLYPGLVNKPANHIVIDGQEIVFVKKEKYASFIALYPGVPNLPSNYIYINKKLVIVVPINPTDVENFAKEPVPAEINDSSKGKVKETAPAQQEEKGEDGSKANQYK